MEASISQLKVGDSRIFTVTLRDITQRVREQEALRESEARFSSFMKHLPGLAWIKDIDGRYTFVNDAAERAFQKPRAQLYGMTDVQIFSAETAAQFTENDRTALASGFIGVETLQHEGDVLHHSLVISHKGQHWTRCIHRGRCDRYYGSHRGRAETFGSCGTASRSRSAQE